MNLRLLSILFLLVCGIFDGNSQTPSNLVHCQVVDEVKNDIWYQKYRDNDKIITVQNWPRSGWPYQDYLPRFVCILAKYRVDAGQLGSVKFEVLSKIPEKKSDRVFGPLKRFIKETLSEVESKKNKTSYEDEVVFVFENPVFIKQCARPIPELSD